VERSLAEQVWRRAKGICEYCLLPQEFDRSPFQIDHIIARKHLGGDDLDNLALACFACNNHKGPNVAGIDSNSGEVIRLFHPRLDRWDEHFEWRGAALVGRTPIGRATVAVLEINLPHRIRLREMLIEEGVFPGRQTMR
jgi:hypothetical protein